MKTKLLKRTRKRIHIYKDKNTGEYIVYKYYRFGVAPNKFYFDRLTGALYQYHKLMKNDYTYQRLCLRKEKYYLKNNLERIL